MLTYICEYNYDSWLIISKYLLVLVIFVNMIDIWLIVSECLLVLVIFMNMIMTFV